MLTLVVLTTSARYLNIACGGPVDDIYFRGRSFDDSAHQKKYHRRTIDAETPVQVSIRREHLLKTFCSQGRRPFFVLYQGLC